MVGVVLTGRHRLAEDSIDTVFSGPIGRSGETCVDLPDDSGASPRPALRNITSRRSADSGSVLSELFGALATVKHELLGVRAGR